MNPTGIGASLEPDETIAYLRFAPDAQNLFDGWRESLENRLRSDTETPALMEHLAKYRSLMPSLALLLHLAGNAPESGSVPMDCANRAIAWCAFLEAPARRVYGAANDAPMEAAELLAARIKASLRNPFTPRSVAKKGWQGLTDTEAVRAALDVLDDRGWVKVVERKPEGGERPSVEVWTNPSLQNVENSESEKSECVLSPTGKTPVAFESERRETGAVGGKSIAPMQESESDAPGLTALGAEVDAELSSYFNDTRPAKKKARA